jgi:hypothetical protein
LNFFCLPFFSGAAPVPAAAGFAMSRFSVPGCPFSVVPADSQVAFANG